MDPTDLAAKANAAANTALDILKKEWFLNLLLWLLLIAELSALWTGRSLPAVVRGTVVHDLGWRLLGPVIDGVEQFSRVVLGREVVVVAGVLMLGLLLFAVLAAFWRDGKRLPHTVIVEVAPINLMLRFTLLVTFAMVFGDVVLLAILLAVTAATYAIGAASGVYSRQRLQGFFFAVMTIVVLGFIALFNPFVLATLALWRAIR